MPIDRSAPSPEAPAAGRAGAAPFVAAVLLAALFAVLLYVFRDGALDLLAMILAATGSIYFGAALATGTRVKTEGAVAFAFVVIAIFGFWWSSLWIAGGYLAHAGWDAVHHRRDTVPARRWFPPFCATFDILVAISILLLR